MTMNLTTKQHQIISKIKEETSKRKDIYWENLWNGDIEEECVETLLYWTHWENPEVPQTLPETTYEGEPTEDTIQWFKFLGLTAENSPDLDIDNLSYDLTGDLIEVIGWTHFHTIKTSGERQPSSFQKKVIEANSGRMSWWWNLVEEETENFLRDIGFWTSRSDFTNWDLPEEEHDQREEWFQEIIPVIWGFTKEWGYGLNPRHQSFCE